jgi:hypothetical protein
MLKIVIKDASVVEETMRGARGDFTTRRQWGWVELASGELLRVRLSVARGHEPYKVGSYAIGDSSFEVGQYKDLMLSRNLELVPLAAAVGPAAKAG